MDYFRRILEVSKGDIGREILIMDTGALYGHMSEMARKMNLSRWRKGWSNEIGIRNGDRGVLVDLKRHNTRGSKLVAGIRMLSGQVSGNDILIGADAIKLANTVQIDSIVSNDLFEI